MVEHRDGPFSALASPSRARLREATMEMVVEHSYDGSTVEMVLARAGVDRAEFERDFVDLSDLCMRIYVANVGEFDRIVFGAVEREHEWRDRLRASAYAALRYVRDRPCEARFNFIQMLEAGEMAQAYRDRYVQRIVDLIDEGCRELEDPDSVGRGVAVGAFGSVYEFLQKQIHGEADLSGIDEFVPQLMYIAVRPYLGHEAAREELTILPPPDPSEEAG